MEPLTPNQQQNCVEVFFSKTKLESLQLKMRLKTEMYRYIAFVHMGLHTPTHMQTQAH